MQNESQSGIAASGSAVRSQGFSLSRLALFRKIMNIVNPENTTPTSTSWETMIESQEPLKLTIVGPVSAFIRHLSEKLLRSPQDVIGGLAHEFQEHYFYELSKDGDNKTQEDFLHQSVIATQRERESWQAARRSNRPAS